MRLHQEDPLCEIVAGKSSNHSSAQIVTQMNSACGTLPPSLKLQTSNNNYERVATNLHYVQDTIPAEAMLLVVFSTSPLPVLPDPVV